MGAPPADAEPVHDDAGRLLGWIAPSPLETHWAIWGPDGRWMSAGLPHRDALRALVQRLDRLVTDVNESGPPEGAEPVGHRGQLVGHIAPVDGRWHAWDVDGDHAGEHLRKAAAVAILRLRAD